MSLIMIEREWFLSSLTVVQLKQIVKVLPPYTIPAGTKPVLINHIITRQSSESESSGSGLFKDWLEMIELETLLYFCRRNHISSEESEGGRTVREQVLNNIIEFKNTDYCQKQIELLRFDLEDLKQRCQIRGNLNQNGSSFDSKIALIQKIIEYDQFYATIKESVINLNFLDLQDLIKICSDLNITTIEEPNNNNKVKSALEAQVLQYWKDHTTIHRQDSDDQKNPPDPDPDHQFNSCQICFVNFVQCILLPCRHSICNACSQQLSKVRHRKCPFCRSRIKRVWPVLYNDIIIINSQ